MKINKLRLFVYIKSIFYYFSFFTQNNFTENTIIFTKREKFFKKL